MWLLVFLHICVYKKNVLQPLTSCAAVNIMYMYVVVLCIKCYFDCIILYLWIDNKTEAVTPWLLKDKKKKVRQCETQALVTGPAAVL